MESRAHRVYAVAMRRGPIQHAGTRWHVGRVLAVLCIACAAPGIANAQASVDVAQSKPLPQPKEAPPPEQTPCGCEEPPPEHVIEVTLGTAQLFNRLSTSTRSGMVDSEIIPVSSALLMTEWLFMDALSAALLTTLPLEEQAVLVDGELHYEFAAPSVLLGMRWTPYGFAAFWDSTVEFQAAAFLGRTLGSVSGDVFFPLAAGRLHVRTAAGFALYIGGAFAFAKDTGALIYGAGHRF